MKKYKIKFLNVFVTSKERSLEVGFWQCSSISKCCKLFSYFIHDHHSCSIILLFQIHEPLSILFFKNIFIFKGSTNGAFWFQQCDIKVLNRTFNFTTSRREMKIEIWFTSQVKGTHVVLTQTFCTFVHVMKNHNFKM